MIFTLIKWMIKVTIRSSNSVSVHETSAAVIVNIAGSLLTGIMGIILAYGAIVCAVGEQPWEKLYPPAGFFIGMVLLWVFSLRIVEIYLDVQDGKEDD